MRTLAIIFLGSLSLALPGHALTFGLFTYTDNGTYITITDYPEDATGAVVIPDTIDGKPVQAIGKYSFINCTTITDVSVPNTVQIIYEEAFGNCSSLANLTLGNSVVQIWRRGFAGCTSLLNITLPDSLESIGDHAFNGCTSLTTVHIGTSLYGLGYNPFRNCPNLTSFSVASDNSRFTSIEGVLHNRHADKLIKYPEGRTGNFTIPSSVIFFEGGAFEYCTQLTGITIPNSVNSVPSFKNCTALVEVTIGNSITSMDNFAFEGCTALTEITIPDSVTTMGSAAFRFCHSLETITLSNSLTSMGNYAFEKCTALTEITIPDSVTTMGSAAFRFCHSLETITLSNSLTSIGSNTFYRCYSLTGVSIPSTVKSIGNYAFIDCIALETIIIPDSVTSIGGSAFSGCGKLTEISIPSSVISIGYLAFHNCSNLASIEVNASNANYTSLDGVLYDKNFEVLIRYPMPKSGSFIIPGTVIEIKSSAFSDSSLLTAIIIPSSVSVVGTDAFQNCTSLTDAFISAGVSSIGSYAFYNCNSLAGTINIPSSVTSIGNRVFHRCAELQSITVDPANPNYSSIDGILYNKTQTHLIDCPDAFVGPHTIPATTSNIDRYAFQSCRGLTEINIPDPVTLLDLSCFKECTSLTNVTLSSNLANIGPDCFKDCTALTDITIPSSVTSIGYNAFQGCVNLSSAIIPNTVSSFGTRVFSDCTKLTQIIFPDSKTSLAGKELAFCTELTSVTLPAATSSIASTAFVYCPKLATINIHPSNTDLTVSGGIVYSFDMTTLVRVPPAYSGTATIPESVTSISAGAFDDCTAITDFVVDAGNTSFESVSGVLFSEDLATLVRCPAGYSGSMNIAANVASIDAGAFAHCPSLTSFSVDGANPNYSSLNGALYNKDQTTLIRCAAGHSGSFQIPDSVSSVNSDAFDGCSGVDYLTVEVGNADFSSFNGVLYNSDQTTTIKCPPGFIGTHAPPASTTSIGSDAFRVCTGLTGISLPTSLTTIGGNAFLGCSSLPSIIIPESVTQISWWAFFNCDSLNTITFLGDAPTLNGFGSLFSTTSGDPTIDHFNDSAGFTSINWKGYPVASMGEGTGIKKWLINEGFSHGQDTGTDLNGDGVALLTAYALNLNPHENLASRMPRGVVKGSNLEMEFFAAAEGINYSVECSDNLINWTTTGVNLSPVDPEGLRTASLPIQPGKRFMRLVMAE